MSQAKSLLFDSLININQIQMGNGPSLCDQASPGLQIRRGGNNRFPYTFQEDSVEISNTVLKTSNFNDRVPQNEFSVRQQCKAPQISLNMKNQLSSISLASFGSQSTEHGEKDPKYYRFKLSGNIYQGQWKNGVPHGLGTLYFQKGSIYIGSLIEGVAFGRGRIIMSSGAYYQGDIKYGKANGVGLFRDGDYVYRGQFRDDKKHGQGEQVDQQFKFEGIFENGSKLKGTYRYNKCIYKGEFANDQFEGQGELQSEDKSIYSGSFREGKFHGFGVFKWADGSQYKGYYVNGQRQGDGEFFNSKNSSLSKGRWRKGVLKGEGEFKDHRGNVTSCIWEDGKMTAIKTK